MLAISSLSAAQPAPSVPQALVRYPNLVDNIERPLRYRPEGQDFVIENGGEFFNRPLYGGNSAFRVDAGDMPEFMLYLPGRGGNMRFGIRAADGRAKWLHEAASITARYRPGEMLYEIRDPLLGANGVLHVHAVAPAQAESLIVRVEANNLANPSAVELLTAYGGANGQRGRRDGDIGTEAETIGEYFQLKPDACRDNRYEIDAANSRFTLRSAAADATLAGQFPSAAKMALVDASAWGDANQARVDSKTAKSPADPIIIATTHFTVIAPLFFAVERVQTSTASTAELPDYIALSASNNNAAAQITKQNKIKNPKPIIIGDDLSRAFDTAEKHFAALRNQITVDTPDPFINAAVAALNVGTDAVWDEAQGTVMHGAIAWRTRLLGWRGPYAMDALGWHDRARRHLSYWATRQNTDPIPDKLPPSDEEHNLSRSEAALHSNGDMANSHYDMNTVYIDALIRHILWTGDIDYAREMWPVLERHLAWERRLFRREFGPRKLPLYEAYAQIWASDDLQYHGGGVTHATAYAYYHNTQAARLARALGKSNEATFHDNEASLVFRAAQEYLWLPDQGMFAEFRDLLGLQRAHPGAALWSFYHAMDCGLITNDQARAAVRYVNTHYPAIPVRGRGVPADEDYQVLSTTGWMPYTWSVNNVVMGENTHTALALWQADRPEYAFRLTKSALLASMFMGVCPGNVGSLNYLDVYRREAQRDFSDGGGITARAIVEGLFGIRPDALAGELTITPGWPVQWARASLRHPDVSVAFERARATDTYIITQNFPAPRKLRLQLLPRTGIPRVTINGTSAPAPRRITTPTGFRFEIEPPPENVSAARAEIVVEWPSAKGAPEAFTAFPDWSKADSSKAAERPLASSYDWKKTLPKTARLKNVVLAPYFNDRVTQIFKNEYRSPRPPFVSLAIPKQGIGAWAGFVHATAEIDDTGLRATSAKNGGVVHMPNGVGFATPAARETSNILFTSLWDNYPSEAVIPLEGRAARAYFLLAGSTNWMQSRIDNGEIIVAYADGTTARLALRNPDTWWPIEQDLFYDDYQFHCATPPPPRINLKTGDVRILETDTFKGCGGTIPGGAATVLQLPLDPEKQLRSLTLRTLSNEVIIGLMAATLEQ